MVTSSFAQRLVGDLVRQQISRARVFERFGIDYCCGGDQTLAQACAKQGLDVEKVAEELDENDFYFTRHNESDWSCATLSELIDHILDTHHAYLRRELPRLDKLMAKVAAVHGLKYGHLHELARVFVSFENELLSHMLKEERVLFPIVKQLERAKADGIDPPSPHCGSVNNPITVIEDEHHSAGEALAHMRRLTRDYTPPPDACSMYRALLAGLAELETDLHLHIHKENNILFPRAQQLEASALAVHDAKETSEVDTTSEV